MTSISIPTELLPTDGRFGCGPSRVRPEALHALAASGVGYMGRSHRQPSVRDVVARIRAGLAELYGLGEDYEVLLGNGGATAFWDAAVFGLIEHRSAHGVFGEFSAKFAAAVDAAPHLEAPLSIEAPYGEAPIMSEVDSVDVYALTHNETSTGVTMPLRRLGGDALTVVDGTSAAGGMIADSEDFDVYYFSPQKAFAADGGLWLALCSPAAASRIDSVAATGRYTPPSLSLPIALDNSRKNQTYNTPALATLFLLADSVEWMLAQGGLAWSSARCADNAATLYSWAEASEYAEPFVRRPEHRSPVTGTVDFDASIDAAAVAAVLRSNGVVDIESYRKLGRNQIRVGLWPTIPRSDVESLIASIEYVVERL